MRHKMWVYRLAGAIEASAVILVLAAALALVAIPDRARLTLEAARRVEAPAPPTVA